MVVVSKRSSRSVPRRHIYEYARESEELSEGQELAVRFSPGGSGAVTISITKSESLMTGSTRRVEVTLFRPVPGGMKVVSKRIRTVSQPWIWLSFSPYRGTVLSSCISNVKKGEVWECRVRHLSTAKVKFHCSVRYPTGHEIREATLSRSRANLLHLPFRQIRAKIHSSASKSYIELPPSFPVPGSNRESFSCPWVRYRIKDELFEEEWIDVTFKVNKLETLKDGDSETKKPTRKRPRGSIYVTKKFERKGPEVVSNRAYAPDAQLKKDAKIVIRFVYDIDDDEKLVYDDVEVSVRLPMDLGALEFIWRELVGSFEKTIAKALQKAIAAHLRTKKIRDAVSDLWMTALDAELQGDGELRILDAKTDGQGRMKFKYYRR